MDFREDEARAALSQLAIVLGLEGRSSRSAAAETTEPQIASELFVGYATAIKYRVQPHIWLEPPYQSVLRGCNLSRCRAYLSKAQV